MDQKHDVTSAITPKWNNSKAFPILDIPKDVLAEAIHEWAEGNLWMEKLLWDCYNNHVVTLDSCADCWYLTILPAESNFEAMARLFAVAEEFDEFEIELKLDYSNPRSGRNWYKPTLGLSTPLHYRVSREKKDIFLKQLSESFKSTLSPDKTSTLFELYHFLSDKESELRIQVFSHLETYTFSVEFIRSKRNDDFYVPIFNAINMGEVFIPEHNGRKAPVRIFNFTASSKEALNKKMQDFLKALKSNWTLEPRTEITEDIRAESILASYIMLKRFEFDLDKFLEWKNPQYIANGQTPVSYKWQEMLGE